MIGTDRKFVEKNRKRNEMILFFVLHYVYFSGRISKRLSIPYRDYMIVNIENKQGSFAGEHTLGVSSPVMQ